MIKIKKLNSINYKFNNKLKKLNKTNYNKINQQILK